jgi:hypothetical protein
MKPALLAVAFAFSGCTVNPSPVEPIEPTISVEGSWLHFAGPITRPSVEVIRKYSAGRKLVGISINSGGGDVEAALEIGRLVQDLRLEVEVRNWCMSSCANYIFPSGTRKRITDGAVVAWHGSPSHLHFLDFTERGSSDTAIREYNATLSKREIAFLKEIGVDPFVSWFGKVAPYSVPNFYALTASDMSAFGIKDVVAPHSYDASYLASLPQGILRIGLVFISADAGSINTSRPLWLR